MARPNGALPSSNSTMVAPGADSSRRPTVMSWPSVVRTDAISRAVASAADASARSAVGAEELSTVAQQMSVAVEEAAQGARVARLVVSHVDRYAQENREVSRIALGTSQRVASELEKLRELLREFDASR